MAKKNKKPYRFVFHRSSLLTKCVVLATLVVTTAALLFLTYHIREARNTEAEKRAEADSYIHSNAELTDRTQNKGSIEYYEQMAKEELGYVKPGTVIFEAQETTP